MRMFVLLVLALSGAPTVIAAAVDTPDAASAFANAARRIRSEDPRVRQAVALGSARSASFRELLARVEARDVIAYVELDPQLRGRLSGRMRWVVSTNVARYVRVSLNPELTGFQLVATLAHELQHVIEVGDAPSVVDEPTLAALYREVGTERRSRSGAWDTIAAQLAGDAVRKELNDGAVLSNQPSLQDLHAARSGQNQQ